MAAIHAGDDVRIERVGNKIVLTLTEDQTRYVLSEQGVHVLHADCHHVLAEQSGGVVLALQKKRRR